MRPNTTHVITRSRRPRRGLALVAAGAVAAVVTGAAAVDSGAPAETRGPRHTHHQLQRDADAIRDLGVTGVQARVTTPAGSSVVTSGVADLRTRRPVPADGRFRIASTRKALVATVALQLVAERRMSLDDTVERWLPGVVRGNGNDGRRITVRHLLQNTSGLNDDLPGYATPAEYREQRYDVHTRAELLKRALAHRPNFAPGTGWGYSNTGFVLAGMVVEQVTGRSLDAEITARITGPLGLRGTSWPGTSPHLPRPHARAYEVFPTGERVDVTKQVSWDPDSVVSTTHDLDRFFRALLGGRLLPPALLTQMRRTVPLDEELGAVFPGARYGLGLMSRPLPCGGVYWGHDGGDAGYLTVTGISADGQRSVVVSASTALGASPGHLLREQQAADHLVTRALCDGS